MEQAPVSLGEPLEEFADLEVVAGHSPDQRHQFLANIFGHGFLVHLEGQVVAALGWVLVERALEELESVVDLAFELFLAEPEKLGMFAHSYAYIYAYFKTTISARQGVKVRNPTKTNG